VHVFYYRVADGRGHARTAVDWGALPMAGVPGNVLAHELTHALEGVARALQRRPP